MSSTSLAIGLVSGSPAVVSLVREAVAAASPSAAFSSAAPDATGSLPECSLVFVDATGDASEASETARRLRASGSGAALAFVVRARDDALVKRGAPIGAVEQIEVNALGSAMAETIERAVGGSGWSGELIAARDELRRAQRIHAAGEIAIGLQHAMNNPLTAVLAEAQLLEMESLAPETMTAVRRIIESTRRLVALVRKLDAVSVKKSG